MTLHEATLSSAGPPAGLREPPSAAPSRRRSSQAAGAPSRGRRPPRPPRRAPFTQLQGSPLQHLLQLLPATARHGPGQAGAPLRVHLLPGHLLGHELAGEARGAEHHQVERPPLGRHDEPTASRGPGRAASPLPGAATAPAAACAPRSRRPARAAEPGPRPRPRPRRSMRRLRRSCAEAAPEPPGRPRALAPDLRPPPGLAGADGHSLSSPSVAQLSPDIPSGGPRRWLLPEAVAQRKIFENPLMTGGRRPTPGHLFSKRVGQVWVSGPPRGLSVLPGA